MLNRIPGMFKQRPTIGAFGRTFLKSLTSAVGTALLDVLVGDSGAGGTKGLAPAPAAGDAAAGKFLNAAGAYSVPAAGNLSAGNAVINGAFMVAQRATTFTDALPAAGGNNDDTYNLDRWILLSDGNDIVDVSQDTADVPTGGLYAAKMLVVTVNKKFGLLQIIERKNCIGLIGNTVTLSFKAKVNNTTRLDKIKAAIISWSSTADGVTSDIISTWNADGTTPTLVANWTFENTPADLGVTTSWASYSVSAAVDTASTTNIAIFIWSDNVTDTDAADTLAIADVQLEIGATATTFEQRSIAMENALCCRYYWQSNQNGTATGFPIVQGYQAAGINLSMPLVFPVRMRVTPTMTKNGTWDVANAAQPTAEFVSVDGFSLRILITALGAGHAFADSSDDWISAAAEL